MKKRLFTIALAAALGITALTGCGTQKSAGTSTPSHSSASSSQKETTNPHEGLTQDYLTGKWVKPSKTENRPVAVMVSNDPSALPQYGTSQADIIYEAPSEADINRLMLIIQNYKKASRIMPVRSCRPYYLYWALGFDSIYVHYGQSWLAKKDLAKSYVDDLNGMDGSLTNVTFFRDNSRKAPQNAYVTGKSISAGIRQKKFSVKHNSTYTGSLRFIEDENAQTDLSTYDNVKKAKVIVPGYPLNKPWFVYDSKKKVYRRYQYQKAQKDQTNGKQLTAKNVIIEIMDWKIADEKHGYIKMDAVGSGKGYYITNGNRIPIRWNKESKQAPTTYTDTSGNPIALNQGKTWVCVVKKSKAGNITFYKTKKEFQEKDTQTK